MTDKKQPEALRLANALEYCDASVARQAINELRLLHAELEALRAGYAAARLDIETLKAQLAAQQPGVAYAALPDEGEPWYGHKFKEQHRGIWRCECGKTVKETTADWLDMSADELRNLRTETAALCADYDADRASHGQAPAQAAPAAVTGPSGYGPNVTVRRRCSDCKACNSESYAVQGDSGHYVYCEHPSLPERKYIGDTHWDTPDWCPAAAPTTQPAPKQEAQEPAAVVVSCHTPSGKRVALYSAKQDLPVGTQLYTAPQQAGWRLVPLEPTDEMLEATYAGQHCSDVYRDMLAAAPQPSPAAQEDALDAACQRACMELPEGMSMAIQLERHAGWIELHDSDGEQIELPNADGSLAEQMHEAVNAASAARARLESKP